MTDPVAHPPAPETGGILFCAATRMELETVWRPGDGAFPDADPARLPGPVVAHAAVTGVGIPATLLALPPLLARLRPRVVVTTGIAGAYPGAPLGIGDLVLGTSETFADLGMELPDEEGFRPLWKFPFGAAHPDVLPLAVPEALRAWPELRAGAGATVNACTGTDSTGAQRRRATGADFETMEGAAVALACKAAGIPVVQVRAVSNPAAHRDMRPEHVARALENLETFWARRREAACAALSASEAP